MARHHQFSFLSHHWKFHPRAFTSGPTATRQLPALRRSGRCRGTRRRAGNTIRAGLRSAPRHAAPGIRRRRRIVARLVGQVGDTLASAAPDTADRRANRRSASPGPSSGGPEFDHAAAGSAPSASMSAARSSTPRAAGCRRRGRRRSGRHRHTGSQACGEHVEGGRDGERIRVVRRCSRTTCYRPLRVCENAPGRQRRAAPPPATRPRCSCQRPSRDAVRPQQPAAGEQHTGDEQPTTHTGGQQEAQRVVHR